MTKITDKNGQTLDQFLAAYDETVYRPPSCAVDLIMMTVAEDKLKILLRKRQEHPWLGQWAVPGGFVGYDEDLDQAAERLLQEKTDLSRGYFRQLYTLGQADRDPRTRVISTVYFSMTPAGCILNTEAGNTDLCWFNIAKIVKSLDERGRHSTLTLDNGDVHIAYEVEDKAMGNYVETRSRLLEDSDSALAADHIKAVNMAMDMLRNRAASTGIMFNLLPEAFTLREAQTVYEGILGHTVDTGNFRRDIRRMLRETGEYRLVHGKRAALYTFDPLYEYLEEN